MSKLSTPTPSTIDKMYDEAQKDQDINEHLEELYNLGKKSRSVVICGLENGSAVWAFAKGLRDNPKKESCTTFGYGALLKFPGQYLEVIDDTYHSNIALIRAALQDEGVIFNFKRGNDLDVLPTEVDVYFLDVLHVYGHMKRQLERYSSVTKCIVIHDTVVDGVDGEIARRHWDAVEFYHKTTYKIEELLKGVQPAIDEFLEEHSQWKVEKKFDNCNGLTILRKTA